ncbi:hypothetical protein HYH03_000037 [Edaphochlamys debaryana]|uniref:Lipid desaturase domain-containing protein n=1 Tax=Edaphochlamys debaryana TaxID=47281 RepID=A0A835YN56_9CHLO|nr:hypothetical protein HYH03_000037 [Edaphochlamys debaryana]|eukprot:KAG2501530.1 hypothetical protein HYH03_000037 [Edaphochlamys debaryana]
MDSLRLMRSSCLSPPHHNLTSAQVASAVEEEDFDDFSLPMPPRRPFVVAAATVETLEKPVVTTTAAPAPTATPAPATPAPAAAASAAPTAAPAPARAPVVEARPAGATVLDAKASTSAPSSAGPSSATAAAAAKAGASKFVVDENENLKATPEQKAWTWVSMAMMGTTFMNATQQIEGPGDVVAFGAAVFAAYVLADLGTGIYHWGVDNYGDGETPVFGRQIAAFQGHHQRPWTITQREFENNMHQVFGPASYPAMGLMVLSPTMPLAWNAWASSFLWLVCMSQQFHAWSHMKKSELPAAVVWLQEAGILVSRKMHGAHHLPPFEANYAIVSGWTNPLLDRIGFYRRLEKIVLDWTGVAPRCSEEVPEEWREQARPEAPASK